MTDKKRGLADSSLITLLRSFSSEEIRSFEKFVSSPYYNTQQPVSRLAGALKVFHPEFDSPEMTKEFLFGRSNPDRKYDDTLFRKYMSNLMKLAEEYLIAVDVSSQPDRKRTFLLDQFERRNQFNLFNRLLDKIENQDRKSDLITNESFYLKHFREELKTSCAIRNSKLHSLRPSLMKSHIYLLLHELLTSTVYGNMMLVNTKSFKESENSVIFDDFFQVFELIGYLEGSEFLDDSEKDFVELCRHDFILMRDPLNTGSLVHMRNSILGLSDKMSKNMLYIFFSHLNIFYLLNISGGNEKLSKDLLENYKFMVDNDLYRNAEREYINFSEYRTILLHSFRMKKTDFAEKLIEKFRNVHSPDQRKEILNYSYAVLNFEKGNYDESLRYLTKLKADNIIMKLDCEVLRIMIFYEKDFLENAVSAVEAFRYYTKNNGFLSKDVVRSQAEFARITSFLIKHKHDGITGFEYQKALREIESNTLLRRKSWLISKLRELKQKKAED